MKCNWSQYNRSLETRGNIAFWFSEEAIEKWQAAPTGKPGRPLKFSDDAILLLAILKFVYHLPFRQVIGFAKSWIVALKISVDIPHYSCLSKRMKKINLPKSILSKIGVTDIVFDTSGVRIYAAGEWKKKKYGGRRRWKKIHLSLNLKTQEIVFAKATDEYTHDLALVEEVLNSANRKRGRMLIDGIADVHEMYSLAASFNKELLTPPRSGASIYSGAPARKRHVKLIRLLGGDKEARSIWAKLTGYSKRACVEGAFSRWKRIFGEELSSRSNKTIDFEVYVKSLILNKMRNSVFAKNVA